MSAAEIAQELNALFQGLKITQDANYAYAAALTFLAYDTLLSFSDEVRHIWSTKWSPPKVLYIIVRYYGLIYLSLLLNFNTRTDLSPEFCKAYHWYYSMGGDFIFVALVNLIFILRIHALYGRSRKVLIFFVTICLGEFGVETYVSWLASKTGADTQFSAPFGIKWPGCLAMGPPAKTTLIAWIPCILVAFFFFLFAMLKLRKTLSNAATLEMVNGGHPTVMAVFMRDGALFFFLILSILLVSMFVTVFKETSAESTEAWLKAVYSFSGSHIILNLRVAGAKQRHTELSQTLPMSRLVAAPGMGSKSQLSEATMVG